MKVELNQIVGLAEQADAAAVQFDLYGVAVVDETVLRVTAIEDSEIVLVDVA